ncbi:MAG: hypothetical protein OXL68_07090 [Paracoccaceae bacterium]|nr:hypothetical protein [Paracoccaceae bacterium]
MPFWPAWALSQRSVDDWFMRVVGGLDSMIVDSVGFVFTATVEFGAIKTGMD